MSAETNNVTTLPCPKCGRFTLFAYLLVDDEGNHMHTRYSCAYWDAKPPGPWDGPCLWSGWVVPGWDKAEKESTK